MLPALFIKFSYFSEVNKNYVLLANCFPRLYLESFSNRDGVTSIPFVLNSSNSSF